MPRPGVVVGLGGTGQWVLTWLKRDLLLSNDGVMPHNVRLLEIDTATRLEAGATRISRSGQREEAVVVGDVTLGEGEFIYVGGDSRPIAEAVRANEFKNIRQWYQAEKWLASQSPATFILDDGAGRLRQFGRLAVFKDILGQETGSRIWRALRTAIDSVRAATDEQRRLEIIVVGSFAGGTGSGMFIDIALLLRKIALESGVHHILRGYFALPSVFTNNPDREMKARCFAAWRELNRFMVVSPDFPMPEIQYVEDNRSFHYRPEKRIFDACYLVDGKRGGQPISEEAKFGVFPMMAEVISAILDEEAGTMYTQWVTQNLAPEYSKRPETPMYSAVGAFTVQVPAHFVQETSVHNYAKAVVLKLLSPKNLPDEEGRLIAIGADRHLALAACDKNLEDPGFSGRSRSRRLLEETASYGGKSAKPTNYHRRIAELVGQATDDQKRAGLVDLLARAGGAEAKAASATASWVTYFPDLGDDPEFDGVRRAVRAFMEYNIITNYGRQSGQKEEEVRANFKKIPEDLRKRFGGISAAGDVVEDYHGECGDALRECQRIQLIIFRQIVRLQLLRILNGDPNPQNAIIARSGKLGYAWDYFDGLVEELNEFLKLMADVKKRREEIKPDLKIAGLSARAQSFLKQTSGKKFLWVIEHPDVKKAEDEYLRAQQRLMELRREDILHFYVTETAREMKNIVVEARDNLQRWIWALSTGDDAAQVPGLWDGLSRSQRQVNNAHSYDATIPKVQKIVADQAIDVKDADLERALRRWEWSVEYSEPSGLTIKALILPDSDDEKPEEVADPALGGSPQLRMEIARQNQDAFLRKLGRSFSGVSERTTVAEVIKREFVSPEKFAREVASVSAEPLFEKAPRASSIKKTNLIRVKCDPKDPFFIGADGLEGILRHANGLNRSIRDDDYGIQVVQSENPYKLTLVRTDDLYRFDHYASWKYCLEAYAAHTGKESDLLDPVLMQNFAAEGRAVAYERRLAQEGGRDYVPLHPRVVMLLEDPQALRQFVYLGMLGLINTSESRGEFRWQLTWTRNDEEQVIWLTRGWNADRDAAQRPKPDILNAIHGYVVIRKSQEPGRNISISSDFAQRLIEREMNRMGLQQERMMLMDNLKSGLVGWLNSEAYEYPDERENVLRQDYADLAMVIELMIKDRLGEIDKMLGSRSDSGSTPFAVYQPGKKSEKPKGKQTGAESRPKKSKPDATGKDQASGQPAPWKQTGAESRPKKSKPDATKGEDQTPAQPAPWKQ